MVPIILRCPFISLKHLQNDKIIDMTVIVYMETNVKGAAFINRVASGKKAWNILFMLLHSIQNSNCVSFHV